MLQGDFVMNGGQAGFILSAPEKGHLQPSGFGIETKNKIMAARFGLYLITEKRAECLPPVSVCLARLGFAVFVNVKAAQKFQSRRGNVFAGSGKGIRTVAEITGGFFIKRKGELRAVALKVITLDAPLHFPE